MAETVNTIKNSRVESTGAVLSVKAYINNDYYLLLMLFQLKIYLAASKHRGKYPFITQRAYVLKQAKPLSSL